MAPNYLSPGRPTQPIRSVGEAVGHPVHVGAYAAACEEAGPAFPGGPPPPPEAALARTRCPLRVVIDATVTQRLVTGCSPAFAAPPSHRGPRQVSPQGRRTTTPGGDPLEGHHPVILPWRWRESNLGRLWRHSPGHRFGVRLEAWRGRRSPQPAGLFTAGTRARRVGRRLKAGCRRPRGRPGSARRRSACRWPAGPGNQARAG
jgi:hypothetical protein